MSKYELRRNREEKLMDEFLLQCLKKLEAWKNTCLNIIFTEVVHMHSSLIYFLKYCWKSSSGNIIKKYFVKAPTKKGSLEESHEKFLRKTCGLHKSLEKFVEKLLKKTKGKFLKEILGHEYRLKGYLADYCFLYNCYFCSWSWSSNPS